ncbi:MAG: hypothetical protein KDK66_03390 [Deltaproteobacteria bacterium]|nr:hypothetical protein [Deltaproteobacteria bacterium]
MKLRKVVFSFLCILILSSGALACGGDENEDPNLNLVGCVNDIVIETNQLWVCESNGEPNANLGFYEDYTGFVIDSTDEIPASIEWSLDEANDSVEITIVEEGETVLFSNVCTTGSGTNRQLSLTVDSTDYDCIIAE